MQNYGTVTKINMRRMQLKDQGLYEVRREHDACGIGAVVNIAGAKDHSIIEYGKEILLNLHHRGAAGADEMTGDGAGILFQIPHEFFSDECEQSGFTLPEPGRYGAGWSSAQRTLNCGNNATRFSKRRSATTE